MSEVWKPAEPFTWIPKRGLRVIGENLELSQAASAKLVYLALCSIAGSENCPTFDRSVESIATLASVSGRTVTRRIQDLERLGLVVVERLKIPGTSGNLPSRYNLVTQCHKVVTPRHPLVTARGPHAVRVSIEQENKRPLPPTPKLSVGDRIGLENRVKHFEAEIQKLKELREWERTAAWKTDLQTLQEKLEATKKEIYG